jgi:superfamily II DNA or RNA helicase
MTDLWSDDAFAWGERFLARTEDEPPDVGRLLPSLWAHQTDAIAQVDEAIEAGETRIVVKIPTGGGKTRLASAFTLRSNTSRLGLVSAF